MLYRDTRNYIIVFLAVLSFACRPVWSIIILDIDKHWVQQRNVTKWKFGQTGWNMPTSHEYDDLWYYIVKTTLYAWSWAWQQLWGYWKDSMRRSPCFRLTNCLPLVWGLWQVLQHLSNSHKRKLVQIRALTLVWTSWPSEPPITLIFPPMIEARAPLSGCGRDASEVQAGAPGRRVTTEETRHRRKPPAATNAWKVSKVDQDKVSPR